MKLVYENMEHILRLGNGYVSELIVENKKMFFEMVNDIHLQSESATGKFILSISDRPVEFSRYVDITTQFAPFQLNRKNLITKLCSTLEQESLNAENYVKTGEILTKFEAHIHHLADELPFEIICQKVAIGPIIRALSPEIDTGDKTPLEQIFAYMEAVRELDHDRLFIMINMRAYFTDEDMTRFIETICLHDFKMLLIESTAYPPLSKVKRHIIDNDLCEF